MKMEVKNQINDVETNRVYKFKVGDYYNTFEVSKEGLIRLVKSGSISNCYIYKNKLLVFKKPMDISDYDFVQYNYSVNLKKRLKESYLCYKAQKERELALNIEPDIIYDIKEDNGLYKLVDMQINKHVNELYIPSFITSLEDNSEYFKSKLVSFPSITDKDVVNLKGSVITIDKYTDGLSLNMLSNSVSKLVLNGLITIIPESNFYITKMNLNTNSHGSIDVVVDGRTRWIKNKGLQSFTTDLNLKLGKHMRVCYLPENIRNITSYDTTLLLSYAKDMKPTILINKNENRDILLDLKSNISEILYGYENIVYDVVDDYVKLHFGNSESLKDFVKNLRFKYHTLNDLELLIYVKEVDSKYENCDTLYWELQSIKQKKIDNLLFQYSFAISI